MHNFDAKDTCLNQIELKPKQNTSLVEKNPLVYLLEGFGINSFTHKIFHFKNYTNERDK